MNNREKGRKCDAWRWLLLPLLLWGGPTLAQVDAQIIQAVSQFITSQLPPMTDGGERSIRLTSPARADLAPCTSPLEASLPGVANLKRNTTVKLLCPQQWQIYVPVRIEERYPLVVAKIPLSAGTVLTASMLDISLHDQLSTPGSSFTNVEGLIGARIKRQVQAGRPIRSNNLCAVCSGDEVTVYSSVGTLTIKTQGQAESDGAPGEQVKVLNPRSGKRFKARVEEVGVVSVRLATAAQK